MSKTVKLIMIVLALSLPVIAAGCSSETSTSSPAAVLQPGSPAPDFTLPGLDGKQVSLSDFKGDPVMLNFWASWCGPCRSEMPDIQEAYEDSNWQEQDLVILAVNMGEDASTVRNFIEENGFTFTVLVDTEFNTGKLYNVSNIPITYFIDRDGIMKDKQIGAFSNKAGIDWRLINSILVGDNQGS